tara:strand:+ start:2608 stop:2787 length:180 start_codon:yes stop_codon:yes gene_type:complete
MELKKYAKMMPLVLKVILNNELEDERFNFVYGQEEYTKDLLKVKKQFKRQLKKTFKQWV